PQPPPPSRPPPSLPDALPILWTFGWDRLPKRIHLACIWLVAIATNLSAYFILAANSWMQHPVGTVFNEETGRAEMVDIGAVLTKDRKSTRLNSSHVKISYAGF